MLHYSQDFHVCFIVGDHFLLWKITSFVAQLTWLYRCQILLFSLYSTFLNADFLYFLLRSNEPNMGTSKHWGGAGGGETKRYWGVYCSPPEQFHTIHCDLSYYGLVSGGRAEAMNTDLAKMVGAARSRYNRDKGVTCGSRNLGKDEYRGYWGRERLGYGRTEGGQKTRGNREEKPDNQWRSNWCSMELTRDGA